MLIRHNPNHCNMQSSKKWTILSLKKGKLCISCSDKFLRKKNWNVTILAFFQVRASIHNGFWAWKVIWKIYLTARGHLLNPVDKSDTVWNVWQMTVLTTHIHILHFQGLLLCLLCVTTFVIPVPHLDRYLRLLLTWILAPYPGSTSRSAFGIS